MIDRLRLRWGAPGGYAEFLRIAIPLILSTASWSIQHFVDRVFLTWYATDALAAALPAGMVNFIAASLFMGLASYVNTFVAQYSGAGRDDRVGPAVWQGNYIAIAAGIVGLGVAGLAAPIFDLIGHDESIRAHEIVYFRVLCYGLAPLILATSLSCFYSGRGRTWSIFAVNAAATAFNVVVNYALIFGNFGAPEMGIEGAAWATNASAAFACVLYLVLLARPRYRERYATFSGWRFDFKLFRRLLRFGGPNGVNFMLDMLSFTFFVLIVGRIGTLQLTATNLAFNINSLAFMPLIGAAIALSTQVGKRLGANDPEGAEYCTWSGVHLAVGYMSIMSVVYLLVPDLFLMPYGVGATGPEFVQARDLARSLLRIVAIYCVFDAGFMMFTAALKCAGDTRYVMWASVILGWTVMVLPPLVLVAWFDAGIYTVWAFIVAFLIGGCLLFYRRFRGGKWKSMRVIEVHAPIIDDICAEGHVPAATGGISEGDRE